MKKMFTNLILKKCKNYKIYIDVKERLIINNKYFELNCNLAIKLNNTKNIK